jgi:hypothetical protein
VKPELRRFGKSQTPVVVIDDFSGNVPELIDIAVALAPFPFHEGNYYPGLRRIFTPADTAANAYVDRMLTDAAQFIAGAFDVDGFNLLEASFSMVTSDPTELSPPQRAPHFDTTDPKHYAVLHYLNVAPGTGTAFFRQRSTGIERVMEDNVDIFVRVAKGEMATLPPDSGYILGSNPHYEQIGAVEAVPDRLIIYQGSLLHSGIIPPDMNRSSNPREGRLTANIFVRGH